MAKAAATKNTKATATAKATVKKLTTGKTLVAPMKLAEFLHGPAKARGMAREDMDGLRASIKKSASDKNARETLSKTAHGSLVVARYDAMVKKANATPRASKAA